MRIFLNAWFRRFARKECIAARALIDAAIRAANGLVDADLGGGVIKQRLPRPGAGRSGGYRTILLLHRHDKVFFVFGFAKSDRSNIDDSELEQFKALAKHLFTLDEAQLLELTQQGSLEEIDHES